jgi:tripartite ATP-independent transporter DctM subunit
MAIEFYAKARDANSKLHLFEDVTATFFVALLVVLPVLEFFSREILGTGIPGSITVVQHLTLLITFTGAALAARSDKLLALATTEFLADRWRRWARGLSGWLAVGITATLVLASIFLVSVDYQYSDPVAWGVPVWVVSLVMPVTMVLIGWRQIRLAGDSWRSRLMVASGVSIPFLFVLFPALGDEGLLIPGLLVILVGTALGLPIFAAIGGAALFLFVLEGTPISAVPGEAYRMATSPMLPAIPLFTIGGYVLAAGGSSQRLLNLFESMVGWVPGGLAVVVTLVLAFFTPLTGASGITILAMGGLLLPLMTRARYPEQQALGLVTVSGSIGVLLPPSLPVIIYAFYAEVRLEALFIGGLVPGLLLVVAVAMWGAWRGWKMGAVQTEFDWQRFRQALWGARFEIVLPFIIIGGIFGGLTTLVEAAAVTVVYALVVEMLIFRELTIRSNLLKIVIDSVTMVGGFMIILSVALALTNYLIIDQIPMQALEWVRSTIESPVGFLLALNLLLIVVGALMDIYSAIIVIVPLIVPIAAAYGIDPVHLGVIFMANMQLGYLMPPMGENLFLSAYRFDKSLVEVYRSTLPYVAILFVVVLLITYVPGLTLGLLTFFDY